MSQKVRLKLAIAEHPHTSAIRDGSIKIEGVEPEFITVKPQIGAFRRMVRDVEFDVCELAPTTYIIARAYGAPFVGLPIFVVRRFHHGGMLVKPDSGINSPKDLEGRKVGVRAYSVTTGVWIRQVFIDEYGMDNSKVTWIVDDEEHVTQLQLPANVQHAPEGRSLADMMAADEIQAGVEAAAGIGRTGAPTGGWQEVDTSAYVDLIPNAAEAEAEYYARTGVYPMHGTIVIKDRSWRSTLDRPLAQRRLYPRQGGMAGKARFRRGDRRRCRQVPRATEDRRSRPAALRHRGEPRDDRGAGADCLQAGPDPAPYVDGRTLRRSAQGARSRLSRLSGNPRRIP
ncbi:PhnD/SsuA/transferrin family substrate-binding protein [Novosphingobium resinovorum]